MLIKKNMTTSSKVSFSHCQTVFFFPFQQAENSGWLFHPVTEPYYQMKCALNCLGQQFETGQCVSITGFDAAIHSKNHMLIEPL